MADPLYLRILRVLWEAQVPMTADQIAEELDTSKQTIINTISLYLGDYLIKYKRRHKTLYYLNLKAVERDFPWILTQ